jgi:hypothetical protein
VANARHRIDKPTAPVIITLCRHGHNGPASADFDTPVPAMGLGVPGRASRSGERDPPPSAIQATPRTMGRTPECSALG